ncbi:hypothetical protein L596_005394 [Steinernema carpocapsae]|uniref:Uncharacterized protein n=1 Tax=Steinernema carpocapsae TaxID=34508 RepID=A0A4U8V0G4_STECR|nr:hypothetical protein L596_005394 [Steinernema carpocapsae]
MRISIVDVPTNGFDGHQHCERRTRAEADPREAHAIFPAYSPRHRLRKLHAQRPERCREALQGPNRLGQV